MVDPTTANIGLAQPVRGSDVGVWDLPVNGNSSILDLVSGGINTIALNNSNVILASSQFQSKSLTFSSTLTGSVTITFPTSFIKSYEIFNTCTGSSAFTVTLQTTAGGAVICAPPGEIIDIVNDGSNLRYKNLGRIGEYWDYAGSSVPAWVSGCTVPPYLACVGGTFSSSTYPSLATILGGTTLPDSRGLLRLALDAGVGRVSSGVSGVAANTIFSIGGNQSLQAHTHLNTLNDPSHVHGGIPNPSGTGGGAGLVTINGFTNSAAAFTGITITNASAGTGGSQNMPPVYVGGITMIRAG